MTEPDWPLIQLVCSILVAAGVFSIIYRLACVIIDIRDDVRLIKAKLDDEDESP